MAYFGVLACVVLAVTLFAIRDRRRPVTIRWHSADGLYTRMLSAREEEEARHAG